MHKCKLLIPVLAGLLVGQLFAEGERPFKVVNTIRVGYDDNPTHEANGSGSTFVTDIVDFSFRAALSDRTDLTVKSQATLLNDSLGDEFYPNLYAMLNHSVSPRLLLCLSEFYRSGDQSGVVGAGPLKKDVRYNYFNNRAGISADYVLTRKDRLQASLDYDILRHEDDVKNGLNNDTTTVEAGTTWKRDIVLQRTYSTLNVRERHVKYDHQKSSFDATDLSAGLSHNFNQEWQGNIEGGVTHTRPDYAAPAKNDSTFDPLVRAGLVYSPSPRTRFSTDFSHQKQASRDSSYGGQTATALGFGVQHDITAKLMAKATVRFTKIDSASGDNQTAANTSNNEDSINFDLRFTYKLNRMNFLELGLQHNERSRDAGEDWEQNRMDIGWRLELN